MPLTVLFFFFSFFSEDEDSDAPQEDASARYSEDEAEWDRLQADVKNRDKILDAKSKESHIVHAPYFPEVNTRQVEIDVKFHIFCLVIRRKQIECFSFRSQDAF